MRGDQGDDVGRLGRSVRGRWARFALVAGGVLLALAVMWMLGPGARWWLEHVDGVRAAGKDGLKSNELAEALDTIRGRAMALGTGLLAAVAIYYTASNAVSARRSAEAAQQTARLTEQGQVTGRYTAAIEQLGSSNLDIRLGGVYALERIAHDSARDHSTVMDVLATFVRVHLHDPDPTVEQLVTTSGPARLRPDLHAALVVLGRRNLDHDTHRPDLTSLKADFLDLSGLSLRSMDLRGADLRGADLHDADLHDADLRGADLRGMRGRLGRDIRGVPVMDDSTRF